MPDPQPPRRIVVSSPPTRPQPPYEPPPRSALDMAGPELDDDPEPPPFIPPMWLQVGEAVALVAVAMAAAVGIIHTAAVLLGIGQ